MSSPCSVPPSATPCGAVYSRRNVRGLPPMVPAVFQVSFAAIIVGILALLFEHPWTATPDAEAIFSILWLGILGSGLAYLLVFRLFANWGATRTTLIAYVIPAVGIVLGYLVLDEPIDATDHRRHALVIAGVGLVNSRFGRRRLFGRCPGRGHLGAPWRLAARSRPRPQLRQRASKQRPADDQHRRPDPARGLGTVARLSHPDGAPGRREDRRRLAQRGDRRTAAPRSVRRGCTGRRGVSASRRPPPVEPPPSRTATGRRRPRPRPTPTSTTEQVAHRIAA